MTLLLKSKTYQDAFANLSCLDELEKNKAISEDFVVRLYATAAKKMTKINKVDEARLSLFSSKFGMSKDVNEESFKKKIKSMNPFNFPPCERELEQQILRTTYITSIWRNACRQVPTDLDPLEFGWCIKNESMACKWFEGAEMPESVMEVLIENSKKGENI